MREMDTQQLVSAHVKRIQDSVRATGEAREFSVPIVIAEEVVSKLNASGTPAYYVCDDCVSAADTYTKLYQYEEDR